MAFRQVANIGKLGVRKAKEVLERAGYAARSEEDLHEDYDLLVSGRDLQDPIRVEVKFDTQILWSGNVSAEWWDDKSVGKEGWLQSCSADVMLYFLDFNWAYAFTPRALREFALANRDSLEGTHVISPDLRAERGTGIQRRKETLNILVPISRIPHLRLRKWEELFGTPVEPPTIGRKGRSQPSKNRVALTDELLYRGPRADTSAVKVKIDDFSIDQ